MTCPVLNHTPFRAQVFPHQDAERRNTALLIVKGTWQLSGAAGLPPRLAAAQDQAAIFREGVRQTLGSLPLEAAQAAAIAPRQHEVWTCLETEYVPPKPCFDLIVNGWAVAPQGRPVARIDAAVDYLAHGASQRLIELRAFAPRAWLPELGAIGRLRASGEATASRIPLLRPFAFGGQEKDPQTGQVHAFERNPEGMGYYRSAAAAKGAPLPWIEPLDRSLASWDDTLEPLALGHVPPHHLPRRALQGTFGDTWQSTRAPDLPEDFDPRHHNAAPDALQLREPPRPGHTLALHGMSEEGPLCFTWPQLALTVQAETAGGTLLPPQELRWDTLLVDTEARRASLLWRAVIVPPALERIGLAHVTAQARAPRAAPSAAAITPS
ncbi:DUF2169 family type VI secretion system accessory protein [Acidovorax sp. NCPPB 3576]|uniref:DUF2169 family type VI secretion system accessory protein n=1 Tax=Acidovorax sp. NCPPB 3576 TaxID=2940488 RepID=UPI00234B7B4E|nr:DUF2169 domain-containing protein [Acidovorax sp. NCPPB 3576]WCM87175.1 DUF2169 domain-containing protein [Acidovorax sp. NCPPB 3576]